MKVPVQKIFRTPHFPHLFLSISILGFVVDAFSQGNAYQKVAMPLSAQVIKSTSLRGSPAFDSRPILTLHEGELLEIKGRQGEWLHASTQNNTIGWIYQNEVRVTKAEQVPSSTKSRNDSLEKEIENTQKVSQKTSARRFVKPERPTRVSPMIGYAFGAKSQPNQLRAGLSVLYTAWPFAEIGGNVELGFKNQTLFSVGPTFVHQLHWPRIGPFRTALYGGFPLFYVSKGGDSDILLGVRVGAEWSSSMIPSSALHFFMRAGAEILLFGAPVVGIPVVGAIGLSFRF